MNNDRLTERQTDGTIKYIGDENDTLVIAYEKLKQRLCDYEERVIDGRLIEKYFVKKEEDMLAKYPWIVCEINDQNCYFVIEQCKSKEEADAKLIELKGEAGIKC